MNRLARLFCVVLATLLLAFVNASTATASPLPRHGSAVFFKHPVSSIGIEADERLPVASSPLFVFQVCDADPIYGPTHFAWSEAAQLPASEGPRRWTFRDGPARVDPLRYDALNLLRVSLDGVATKPAAEVDDVLGSLPKGDSKGDRVRVAGSDAELGEKWDDLTRGGTPGEWKNYDGEVIDPSLTLIVRGGVGGGGGGGGGGRVRGKALLGWDHFSF